MIFVWYANWSDSDNCFRTHTIWHALLLYMYTSNACVHNFWTKHVTRVFYLLNTKRWILLRDSDLCVYWLSKGLELIICMSFNNFYWNFKMNRSGRRLFLDNISCDIQTYTENQSILTRIHCILYQTQNIGLLNASVQPENKHSNKKHVKFYSKHSE